MKRESTSRPAAGTASRRLPDRLRTLGAAALSNAELLAVVLARAPRGSSALGYASALLAEAGGITPLLAATHLGLARSAPLARLSAARELLLRSMHEQLAGRQALANPGQVRAYLALLLRDLPSEAFVGVYVDSQHRVISALELFRGTLSQTAVYPREVARHALRLNASAVILAHNHPSGVAEPSMADRVLTDALRSALAQIDVAVLDHLIVAGNRCVSFAERGWL